MPATPWFIRKYIFATDHKVIGIQFMMTGLVFFALGGLFAMAIRYQLAWPWAKMPVIGNVLFPNTGEAITPEFYTMLFTMHGTIMIFFVIMSFLVEGGGPAAGWTAHPPLSTISSAAPGSLSAQTWWLMALRARPRISVTFRRPSPPLATLRLLRVSSEYASAARLARNDDGSPKP
ncbi:MAG: hypothetical protein GY711_09575, partial [bacterium]|nr:hypothetical protein [bacterium]